MGKLTDAAIRGWIKAGAPIVKTDGDGLTFTMTEAQARAGTASWVLRYRFDGKPREMTLGKYPDVRLADARLTAAEYRVKVGQGVDVAREKQRLSVERRAAKSLRELGDAYMARRFRKLATSTQVQRRRHIEKDIYPALGHLAARDVTTGHVVELVERVGKRSVSVAELVLTALSEIFKFGIAKHAVTANPCVQITVNAICDRAEPRQRIMLSEAELRALLPVLEDMGRSNALAVRLLLVTAVRINELTNARWENVDFAKAEWTIPPEQSKTKRGFTIPLPACAVEWMEELEALAGDSLFVLPARQERRIARFGGDAPMQQRAINARLAKLTETLEGVRRIVPHDLRSTARSWFSALGVDPIVAERCLNHSLGGIMAIYDQHDYMQERRAALDEWGAFLTACESGTHLPADNVIRFPARA